MTLPCRNGTHGSDGFAARQNDNLLTLAYITQQCGKMPIGLASGNGFHVRPNE